MHLKLSSKKRNVITKYRNYNSFITYEVKVSGQHRKNIHLKTRLNREL